MKDFFSLLDGILSQVLIIIAMYVLVTTHNYDKVNFLLLVSVLCYLECKLYFIEKKIDEK